MLQNYKYKRVNVKKYDINKAQRIPIIRLMALKNVICVVHKYLVSVTKQKILTCEC